MSSTQLPAADFTRDQYDTQPSACDRCKKVIPPGKFRGYVASVRPTHPGMYCCQPCYIYYKGKVAVVASLSNKHQREISPPAEFASGSTTSITQGPNYAVDIRGIHSSVNKSQREGYTSYAGRVTPLRTSIPLIQGVPSLANPSYNYGQNPAAIGYTPNHAKYLDEREYWAHRVHVANVAHGSLQPRVSITARLSGGNAPKFVITEFCEATLVEQEATGQMIHDAVLLCLQKPLSNMFPDLPVDLSRTTVRHQQTWLAVLEKAKEQWWGDCYDEKKKGGRKFVSPSLKAREFCLVFPTTEWQAMQDFNNNIMIGVSLPQALYFLDKARNTMTRPGPFVDTTINNQTTYNQPKNFITSDKKEKGTKRRRSEYPSEHLSNIKEIENHTSITITSTSSPPKKKPKALSHIGQERNWSPPSLSYILDSSQPQAANPPTLIPVSMSSASITEKANEVPGVRTRVEQLSIHTAVTSGGQLAGARPELLVGGHMNKRVTIYPILILMFRELVIHANQQKLPFSMDPSDSISGILHYNRLEELGRGAAKSAFTARFTPFGTMRDKNPLLPADSQNLVLKRFFRQQRGITVGGVPLAKLRWFTGADEVTKVFNEGNALAWAAGLLQLAYEFIDAEIARRHESDRPQFAIPRLRMAKGFIATCDKENGKAPGLGASTLQGTYLLEEMIDGTEGPFQKYINNTSSSPVMEYGEQGYETAIFLCFVQHVQYVETQGAIFTTDFQGGRTILTDPQIISNPLLGNNLFSGGNIKDVFYNFPKQHECNPFCDWFGLEPLANSTLAKEIKETRARAVNSIIVLDEDIGDRYQLAHRSSECGRGISRTNKDGEGEISDKSGDEVDRVDNERKNGEEDDKKDGDGNGDENTNEGGWQ